jgi:outer membrane murein-binding lipoprotein Lpp
VAKASDDQKRLRSYLVGELDEASMSAVEEQYFRDASTAAGLDVAADDLIDQYVSGHLSANDRARVANLLASSNWRERLRVSKVLSSVRATSPAIQTIGTKPRWLAWAPSIGSPSRRLLAGLTAAAVVVVASGTATIVEKKRAAAEIRTLRASVDSLQEAVERARQAQSRLQTEHNQRLELERIVGSLRTVSFVLVPGVSRGPSDDLRVPADAQFVQLQLGLEGPMRRSNYRAVLRTERRQTIWIEDLPAPASVDGNRFPELRLPAATLQPSQYQLSLQGADSQGRFSELASYAFRIVRQ